MSRDIARIIALTEKVKEDRKVNFSRNRGCAEKTAVALLYFCLKSHDLDA